MRHAEVTLRPIVEALLPIILVTEITRHIVCELASCIHQLQIEIFRARLLEIIIEISEAGEHQRKRDRRVIDGPIAHEYCASCPVRFHLGNIFIRLARYRWAVSEQRFVAA